MKRKMKLDPIENYVDAPEDMDFDIDSIRRVDDLLPPPDKMTMKRAKDKEIIAKISETDLKYLKEEAKERGVSSKVWIRGIIHNLVNSYVNNTYNAKRKARK